MKFTPDITLLVNGTAVVSFTPGFILSFSFFVALFEYLLGVRGLAGATPGVCACNVRPEAVAVGFRRHCEGPSAAVEVRPGGYSREVAR